MKNATIIIVIVIAAILLFWIFGRNQVVTPATTTTTTTETTNGVTTTPGVYIAPATNTGTTVTAKLGQNITFNGVVGTIISVAEDSRCPTDVQCIQAGTVRVNGHFTYGTQAQDVTLGLNQTYSLSGHSITLLQVTPDKVSTKTINPSNYTFTFLVN